MVTNISNSNIPGLTFVDRVRGRRRTISETIKLVNSMAANTAYVEEFGAIGNGIADDTRAFQTAINSLGKNGGKILLANDRVYRIASNITLNPSCHLEGHQNMIGSNGYNFFTNYDVIGGTIRLDSRATINMRSGSSISKMLIRQSNLNYLSPTSFAGTAITITGNITNQGNISIVGDDTTISDVMILGFNQAIFATNAQRIRVSQCNIDSNNGILINSSYDVPYIDHVHCWPFATIAAVARGWAPNPNGNALTRVGTAFKFQNTVDWGKISDSFSYGYQRGFWVDSCNSCEFTGCGADNVPEAGYSSVGQTGDIGFLVTGGSTDTLLTNCQSASNEKGFYINTVSNVPTQLTNCVAWYNRDHAVLVEGGDVTVLGGIYRNSQYGIKVDSASSNISLQTIRFSDITTKPIFSASPSMIMEGIHFENWANSSPVSFPLSNFTVPTSNILTIPNEGKFFNITSSKGLGNVQYGWPGRTVTFKFNTDTIVLQSTGVNGEINLKTTANTLIPTNGVLTIVSDGTSWYQV